MTFWYVSDMLDFSWFDTNETLVTLTYNINRVQQLGLYDEHDERVSIWFKKQKKNQEEEIGHKGKKCWIFLIV